MQRCAFNAQNMRPSFLCGTRAFGHDFIHCKKYILQKANNKFLLHSNNVRLHETWDVRLFIQQIANLQIRKSENSQFADVQNLVYLRPYKIWYICGPSANVAISGFADPKFCADLKILQIRKLFLYFPYKYVL
jgi:hypothetical protein